jgi:radical SAM superfamily enzyme YgiQ (UPF0313 family)
MRSKAGEKSPTRPGKKSPTRRDESLRSPLRICLITSLSVIDFVDPEVTEAANKPILPGNVGILTLAAVLRRVGYDPCVINLDDAFLRFRTRGGKESRINILEADPLAVPHFYPVAVSAIPEESFDVYGLSSICSSYPLTIRIAEEIKRLHPNSYVVLGGPQASVVDVETMSAFPFVDFVLRGEAEQTLPSLLACLEKEGKTRNLEDVEGLTYRVDGHILRNRNASPIDDLDSLPLPAFDLDPDFKQRTSIELEIGRGCPFACTFCSTNDFFRRHFRLKSTAKTIEEILQINHDYGISAFSFIHDMYTVNRKKVVEFCEALLARQEKPKWTCSARTDCIDDELIALMAKAGCAGIFFGIETGSARMQKVIKKNLDLNEAKARIKCTAEVHRIKTAVSLICGFPEETRDDLRDTIHFFIESCRFHSAEPQMALLAPLAATPVHEEYRDRLVLDDIFSDMSYQGWHQDPADLELIKSHGDVFPNFYAVPTRHVSRSYLKQVRDFVTQLVHRFRWLPVALLQDCGDFLVIFEEWKTWILDKREATSTVGIIPYMCSVDFRGDFLEFVRTRYLNGRSRADAAIAALVEIEGGVIEGGRGAEAAPAGGTVDVTRPDLLNMEDCPHQSAGTAVRDIGVDYSQLILALQAGADLVGVPRLNCTIVMRKGGNANKPNIEVWQLTPLLSELLKLCDGTRCVRKIASEFALLKPTLPDIPVESGCLFGLAILQDLGLVNVPNIGSAIGERDGAEPQIGHLAPFRRPREYLPQYVPLPEESNTQRPWPWDPRGEEEPMVNSSSG